MENLTPSQKLAVAARGNVLVMAGAGTGKTRTLVERCLDCLCTERASLDEMLIVTFTDAAAAEVRQRIAAGLEKKSRAQPDDSHWNEQLALFDTAHIGTLHGFCLRLVREHFYELGLDPQLAILDAGEARLLADETLDEQFKIHYAGQDEFSIAVQNLIRIYGNGDERPIRAILLRLHHYAQTRPDADRWLARQLENFSNDDPIQWREWFSNAISDWRDEWLPALEELRVENEKAAECLAFVKMIPGSIRVPRVVSGVAPETSARRDALQSTRDACAPPFQKILAADELWPRGKKTAWRKPLEDFFDDAKFFHSLLPTKENDPLGEDWSWVHGQMETLLRLAQEFAGKFSGRKRDDGVLDFHDLEQFALKLLWDSGADKPTAVAGHWREKIRFVFVDEYQDINAAQDKIIFALSSGTGFQPVSSKILSHGQDARATNGNRFLVGDVKQSIYRFRLADPKIFRDYARDWRGENGQTIPLSENFRSRESLLGFVNSIFSLVMREEIGGVAYDAEAQLKFGAPESRAELGLAKNPSPRAELLLRFKNGRSEEADDDELPELEEAEKEARLIARRFRELVAQGHEIWDDQKNNFRPVEWRDMAVLLRAPSGKSESFAKEFERAGVPLSVARGGFYDSSEILDLLSLLQLLDNPLQDVPAIGVLRSPLVGLSLDELAEIRLAAGNAHFWTALNRWREQSGNRKAESGNSKSFATVNLFLERFSRWRKLAKQNSLSQCLEEILAETHYAEWLRSRPRGAQRGANVGQFLHLAQQFDQFQRQGLFRFLKFIKAQREIEAEPEVPAVPTENAVRLMSIHQSKGLEFPVVAVADLAKNFNEQDLRGEIIFDEQFGLCPRVKPPHTGRRYPSLPHWLAQRHQRRELRGEELRLLYVALTRARDTLILATQVSEKKWETLWTKPGAVTAQKIVAAKSFADWLGLWFANQVQSPKSKVQGEARGELPHLRWRVVNDEEFADEEKAESGKRKAEMELPELDGTTKDKLQKMLSWQYEFGAATTRAAKSSVTTLRWQAEEMDDEAEQVFRFPFSQKRLAGTLASPGQKRKAESGLPRRSAAKAGKRKLSAAETGVAHHKFLQHFALEKTGALATEAERLARENYLSAEERDVLDLKMISAFWNSETGQKILRHAANVKREFAFTAKFNPAELDEIFARKSSPELAGEFVVVQGVADLVVLLPQEIWLVDFKTDEVDAGDLPEKTKFYAPQLKLYARALAKIYSRPVMHCWLHFLSARETISVEI